MSRTPLLFSAAICGLAWMGVATAALLVANEWWLSGLVTATAFAWLALVLAVVYQQGAIRAASLGGAITAFAYWLLALGPWFQANVGPTLLTSRTLAEVDVRLHGPPPQTQALALTQAPTGSYWTPTTTIGGSGVVTMPQTANYNVVALWNSSAIWTSSTFQVIGHWLLIWICGLAGAVAAVWMHARAGAKKPAAATETRRAGSEPNQSGATDESPIEHSPAEPELKTPVLRSPSVHPRGASPST